MKQEDKELLLKDICARLPYGVKCKYYDCCEGDYDEGTICGFERQEYMQIDGVCILVEEVKPYLLPLSSMTDEQKTLWDYIDNYADHHEAVDWLNKNHFDYRGLIDMGLALDTTNKNIY